MKSILMKIWPWARAFILSFLLILFLKTFVFFPIPVVGQSMKPTLNSGNQLILENFSKIKRFDLIVFRTDSGQTFIKRVIGLPGESIAYRKDKLYVNDKYVAEPFLTQAIKRNKTVTYTSDFTLKELTNQNKIAKDQYFVMGDNRHISKDSRTIGTISRDQIIGQAIMVYYPIKAFKML